MKVIAYYVFKKTRDGWEAVACFALRSHALTECRRLTLRYPSQHFEVGAEDLS